MYLFLYCRCDHSRVSKEVYFDLPLYLPKKLKEMLSMTPIKLQELLSAFFEVCVCVRVCVCALHDTHLPTQDELIDCKCEACGHGSSLLCRQLARLPRYTKSSPLTCSVEHCWHVEVYNHSPLRRLLVHA